LGALTEDRRLNDPRKIGRSRWISNCVRSQAISASLLEF
jgi:hypothetical protein